jgi:hypothetical protein
MIQSGLTIAHIVSAYYVDCLYMTLKNASNDLVYIMVLLPYVSAPVTLIKISGSGSLVGKGLLNDQCDCP